MRNILLLLSIICLSAISFGAQTPFVITSAPMSLVREDDTVYIKWTGAALPGETDPATGTVYLSRTPEGGVLDNYTDSIDLMIKDNTLSTNGTLTERVISFIVSEQATIENGIYYLVVGNKSVNYYSNEIQFIVDGTLAPAIIAPSGDTVESSTPTFYWEGVPNVPYYHIIVSDEEINVDIDSQAIDGLSIVWQAITSAKQITYGAPDPSNSISATPPPLSPNKVYSWLILNNYGNNPAFSSQNLTPPRTFVIAGKPMNIPVNILPINNDSLDISTDSVVEFKWTNLDTLANTYKMYIYTTYKQDGLDVQMSVWDGEIINDKSKDTLTVDINLGGILTSGDYLWKVIAVDNQGAGQAGELNSFHYSAPSGNIYIRTWENIVTASNDTVKNPLGVVQIKSEVIGGSLAEPLLSFTNDTGSLSEKRPVGTVKLTASRDGYNSVSKTVDIIDGSNPQIDFYLPRPGATVFGKVLDSFSAPIDIATVIAVSDRGDTVTAETDPSGNFTLNCYADGWVITSSKTGYNFAIAPVRVVLDYGDNTKLSSDLILNKMQFSISGRALNTDGLPIAMAQVKLSNSDGNLIGEVPLTSSDGTYSFNVNSGKYSLEVTKAGFSSSIVSLDVVQSVQKDVILSPNAVIMNGSIYGSSYNSSNEKTIGVITGALIIITSPDGSDTLAKATSDSKWGKFSISVPILTEGYLLSYSADGYYGNSKRVATIPSQFYDTLNGLGYSSGIIVDSLSTKIRDVVISLLDSNQTQVATAVTDIDGEFELNRVPEGVFTLNIAGNGYVLKSLNITTFDGTLSASSTIYVKDGRLLIDTLTVDSSTIIKNINATVEIGTGEITWVSVLPRGGYNDSSKISIISPLYMSKNSGENFTNLPYGNFILTINPVDSNIIDCSRWMYRLSEANSPAVDSVNMPFYHSDNLAVIPDTTGEISLEVEKRLDANVVSALIYHKYPEASSFTVDTLTSVSVDKYIFKFRPDKSGAYLDYYFQFVTDSINGPVYGYDKETYRSYVIPNKTLVSKIQLSPSIDTILLPLGGTALVNLNAFYGGNFTKIDTIPTENVIWSASNSNIKITPKEYGYALIEGLKPSSIPYNLVVKIKDGNGLTIDKNETADSVMVPIKVGSSKLSSIKVIRLGDYGGASYLPNNQMIEFGLEAYDSDSQSVTVTPRWTIVPKEAGEISLNGQYTPNSSFMGRVFILADIGELVAHYKVGEVTGQLISASVVDSSSGLFQSGGGFKFSYLDSSAISGAPVELTVDYPVLDNKLLKSVGQRGVSLISTVYDIRRQSGSSKFRVDTATVEPRSILRADSIKVSPIDSVIASIEIPEEYRSLADENASNFTIGVWVDSILTWAYHNWKDSAVGDSAVPYFDDSWPRYDKTTNSLSFPVGEPLNRTAGFARFAVLYRDASELHAGVKISPNPFSPYVSPVTDYANLTAMSGDIKGTCIKITPFNSTSTSAPNVTVDIYTTSGELVWTAKLNGTVAGRDYYVFWDGRTRITKNASNLSYKIQENTPLVIKGNEMCRNGRYFVITTFDDGNNKKRITKEVILFK